MSHVEVCETQQGDILQMFGRTLIYRSFNAAFVSCCMFVLLLIKAVSFKKTTASSGVFATETPTTQRFVGYKTAKRLFHNSITVS